jgi:hypothetical protein
MKTTFKKSLITTSILAGLYGTSASHAMTIDESTIMGSDFSDDFSMPTELSGATGVTGMFGDEINDRSDNILLTGLPTGMQTFNLLSTAVQGTTSLYLNVFEVDNGSTIFIDSFDLNADRDTSFETPSNFNGGLRLWIYNEGGQSGKVTYSVELQPVPVPAAALLFASGLGALGAAKARRKAKRRT